MSFLLLQAWMAEWSFTRSPSARETKLRRCTQAKCFRVNHLVRIAVSKDAWVQIPLQARHIFFDTKISRDHIKISCSGVIRPKPQSPRRCSVCLRCWARRGQVKVSHHTNTLLKLLFLQDDNLSHVRHLGTCTSPVFLYRVLLLPPGHERPGYSGTPPPRPTENPLNLAATTTMPIARPHPCCHPRPPGHPPRRRPLACS